MAPKSKKPSLVVAAPAVEAPADPIAAAAAETVHATEEAVHAAAHAASDTGAGYYDTLSELSRENFDAVLKANTVLVDGFEAMATEAAGHVRDSVTAAGQATKDLLGARTLDQVVGINAALAQSGWETLLKRSAQFSELSFALAKGFWLPLHSQAEAAFAKAHAR